MARVYEEFVQVLPSYEMFGNNNLQLAVDPSGLIYGWQCVRVDEFGRRHQIRDCI
jgi:hypothetical protein